MSNYLAVVAPAATIDRVARWLAGPGTDAGDAARDIVRWPAADGHEVLIASRGAAADASAAERVYLRGHAIDYANRRVVFGGRPDEDADLVRGLAAEATEGAYLALALDHDGRRLSVSTDLFRMLQLLSFEGPGCVAFSDSILLLAELRHALDLPVTADTGAAEARVWGNAMGGQFMSPHTLVEQVTMVPLGQRTSVEIGPRLSLARRAVPLGEIFTPPAGGYGELLRAGAREYVGLLEGLASLGPDMVRFSASGGLDSRANLAAFLLSDTLRGAAGITCMNTAPQHAADFAVVKEMSEAFGFALNRPTRGERPVLHRTGATLGYWYLASGGIYDFLVTPGAYVRQAASFNVGGHGAEILKGQYGWRTIAQIARNVKGPGVAEAFRREAERGLASMGVEPDDPIGSEWHFLGHRNAIHSGRFTQTSMIGMRPYQARSLLALERSGLSGLGRPRLDEPCLVHDLVLTIHPEAAMFRYDKETNTLPPSYVEERLAVIGGPLAAAEVEPFTVRGHPSEVTSGYSELFRGVAERRGLWLAAGREEIRGLVEASEPVAAEHGLGEAYAPVFAEARERLADESVSLRFSRGAIGKAISFQLLA